MNRGLRAAFAAVLGLAFVAPAWAAKAGDGIWREVTETAIQRGAQARQIVPDHYRSFELDRTGLAELLATAPREDHVRAANSGVELQLPLPDGKFGTFRFVESPVMEPALAEKYPDIKTYLGQGIDDASATVRFDVTPKGFHAQIISAVGTMYIDPFQPGDVDHYISYNKRDHTHGERGKCEVTGEEVAPIATSPCAAESCLSTWKSRIC
jgi:hypothetical protein